MSKPRPKTRPRKPKAKSRLGRLRPSRGLVSVILSIVSLALLGTALIAESVLLLVVSGLSALATVLQVRRTQQRAQAELKKAAAKPRARRPRPAAKTAPAEKPEGDTAEPTTTGGRVVLCTETGRPTEGDQKCDCASRHITSSEGVDYFGRPLGSPLGRRKKTTKSAMTS